VSPATNAGCPIQAVRWLEWDNGAQCAAPHLPSPPKGIFLFALGTRGNRKLHIESHDPTQAKGRLEWGTQHLLLVGLLPAHPPVHECLGAARAA
jgi:hypothetical protein